MTYSLRCLALSLLMAVLSCSFLDAQIHVRMRLNTATNLDTLRPTHFVQIRGEVSGTVTPAIAWDNASGLVMQNVGGDYWEAHFTMTPGSIIKYKFWTGFNSTTGTFFWTGWEGPLNSPAGGGNRQFIAGNNDTVVTLQFYNGTETARDQYWRPYQVKADSIAIFFRVNMAGIKQAGVFDPDTSTGPVAVRGDGPFSWDTSRVRLTRETGSVNGGSFYSGVVYIPKSRVTTGQVQKFKFMIESSARWEDRISDRSFIYSNNLINTSADTTLGWVYFQNLTPFNGTQVTATLSWRLKLDAMENMHLFDRGLGDKVMIIGPKGWTIPDNGIPLTFVPALQEWVGQETFTKYVGEDIIYKYYIQWDTSRVSSTSPNYIPALRLDDGWEEAGATGGADRHYLFTDQTQQSPVGDFGYPQQFFNSIPPQGVITNAMTVKFNINMTNATRTDSNAANTLFRPGIDTAYIQFDGSILTITQGKSLWGTDNRIMLSDPDGDLVYSGEMALTPPFCYQAAFRITYTSSTGEVTNGGGVQLGRRYYQYIRPTSVNPIVWPATYNFPVLPWRAANLVVETPPDLITGNDKEAADLSGFALTQNYPNPFNPSTAISYSLQSRSKVSIQVFDITGRLVRTLVDCEQNAGNYNMSWNGTDTGGKKAASGIYMLRMKAGSFVKSIKMVMLK